MMTEIRRLPVKLTTEERNQLARKLADEMKARAELESAARLLISAEKEKLRKAGQAVMATLEAYQAGHEIREVSCSRRVDWSANKVEITRDDTGEVVESWTIDARDRQLTIPLSN